MASVGDALGSWLLGQLAIGSRKRVGRLALGSDQERALAQASSSAVQGIAEELYSRDNDQAEQLVLVLGQLFNVPIPQAPPQECGTLLESIQAAIAQQLAPLDDASLSGTGQSSADLLGISVTTLTEALTTRLIREIAIRGATGGPLAPLAGQLNHEASYLQGQRIERMLHTLGASTSESRGGPERSLPSGEGNLLFRIYVPSGRLYATETEKLLALFQDWLSDIGRQGVRQEGYRTAAGQVYEFFGEEHLNRQGLVREFDDFTDFLAMCIEDSTSAAIHLTRIGMDRRSAEAKVARYSKEVRRLNLDLRHERESRMLAIRHILESELLEAVSSGQATTTQIDRIIDTMIPDADGLAPIRLLNSIADIEPRAITVNINQQVIHAIESAVVQNVQGTVNLGSQAKDLLDLVHRFGGQDSTALQSALLEFEDPDAPPSFRKKARGKLKAFLLQLGGKVEDAVLTSLMAYIQTKIGL